MFTVIQIIILVPDTELCAHLLQAKCSCWMALAGLDGLCGHCSHALRGLVVEGLLLH